MTCKTAPMPDPIKLAPCGDQMIAYHEAGSGPALVLAHGLGLDQSLWDALLPLLPQGLRIIRFDLRGHGASATPQPPYGMGALVRDAESLLDHLKVRDCVFLGTGLGGMVAQGLAVKRLDQIRALILTNTASKIGTKETWARQMETLQAGANPLDPKTHFTAGFRNSPAFAAWQARQIAPRLEGVLGCAAAISGTDFYTPTASLRLPSLVIASTQDAITPADMVRDLADLIPGAEFAIIRKSGHLPMLEQPRTFAAILSDFLHNIGHI
ncbi:alpha/beta fold hydrolase [Pseudorhodobacter aquimaris]|uniref:alpha/beta fold hydrolase n=1 Tax=Pseudorhodobacter aquimaris TaxID=687412 RepID=UPI001E630B76|nr:alpha/beta fold hydrolase [Pseudorhodobacter aquimaris]